LRGIAQAQKEVNEKGGINGIPIKVAIAHNPTRENIKQTLSSPDFSTQGASGAISFLPSGDRNILKTVKIST
jgi:ABC-type branched-subunit amino acid transport system substrate-binding protein